VGAKLSKWFDLTQANTKAVRMDFIQRWFHVSPDGGNGIVGVFSIVAFMLLMIVLLKPLRRYLSSMILWYLEQLGKREGGDRFDF
jgi:hypothetical protein